MLNPDYHPHHLRYCSYLLRLWLEDAGNLSSPRIILINPQTGDRQGFVDLDGLVSFLSKELSDQAHPNPQEAEQPSIETALPPRQPPKLPKGE